MDFSRPTRTGPTQFTIPGVNGSEFAPGDISRVSFRWPRDLHVTGISLLPIVQGGGCNEIRSQLANLRLRIQDQLFTDVFTDGQGTGEDIPALATNGLVPLDMGGEFACLMTLRAFPMQRAVRKGDIWTFTITLSDGSEVNSRPEIWLRIAEP